MEKKIVVRMEPSREISVMLNEHKVITIGKTNRSIKANDIYELLDYKRGDIYTVEGVNEDNLDVPVLQFFIDLFKDITERLNRLSKLQDNDENEDIEETDNSLDYIDNMDDK